jgi:hypothetical protein
VGPWLLVAASVLAWSWFLLAASREPGGSLGGFGSDHYSHYMSSALFFQEGLAVWTRPIHELCEWGAPRTELGARSAAAAPGMGCPAEHLCWARDGWTDQPLRINWVEFPRPYPPGNVLLFAPIGWAWARGWMDFVMANAILLVSFVVAAHAWAITLWRALAAESLPVRVTLASVGAAFVLFWSMAGFYDAVPALLVLAGILQQRRGRPALACLAFSTACFLHFRALWYAPLVVASAWTALRRGPDREERAALGLAAVCLALTAGVLFLLAPALPRFPVNHPVYLPDGTRDLLAAAALAAPWIVAARLGHHALASVGICATVLLTLAPQGMPWHGVMLLGLWILPAPAPARHPTAVRLVCVAWTELVLRLVLHGTLVPGWLLDLPQLLR